jgi:hypothetical protein
MRKARITLCVNLSIVKYQSSIVMNGMLDDLLWFGFNLNNQESAVNHPSNPALF